MEEVLITITADYSDVVSIKLKMKAGSIYDEEKIKDLVLENYQIDRKNIVFS